MEPNKAFRDRRRQRKRNNNHVINVSHVDQITLNCAGCGKRMSPDLRGVDTLDLSKFKCYDCRREDKHRKTMGKHGLRFSTPKAVNFRCGECGLDFKMVAEPGIEFFPSRVKCPICEGEIAKWYIPTTS